MLIQADHSDVPTPPAGSLPLLPKHLPLPRLVPKSSKAGDGGDWGWEGEEGDFFGDILPASPALAEEVVSPEKQGSINKHGIPWEAGWEGSPASSVPLTEMVH